MGEVFQIQPFVSDTVGTSRITLVLFISGFLGFGVGMFGHATWQVAVEGAQVVAGIVEYPRQNPYYISQTKIWTLLHQIPALLLLSGVAEKTLSFLITGLEGMLSFQALSLCVLTLSQNPVLAIASPFFIHFTRAVQFGVIYPVSLVGQFTYGIVGLSFILLVIVLLSIGQYKLGGVFLGIAPAIHPSLGILLWLTVLICFIWDFRNLHTPFKKAAKYMLLGCAVSVISLTFHLLMTYDVPKISPEDASRYLYTFLHYWDGHRRPLYFLWSGRYLPGIYMNVAVLAICLVYLVLFNRDVPERSLFLMRAFVVSSILGLGFAVVSTLPLEVIPNSLLILMPARWLNLSVLGFMALLIGLLGHYKSNFWVQCSLTALVVVSWLFAPAREAVFLTMSIFSLALIVLLISRAHRSGHLNEVYHRVKRVSEIPPLALALIGFGMITIALIPYWFGSRSQPGFGPGQMLLVIAGGFMFLAAMGLYMRKFQVHRREKDTRFLPLLLKVNSEYLSGKPWVLHVPRGIAMLVLGLIIIETGMQTYSAWEVRKYELTDYTNDPFFAEASKGSGILLTSSNLGWIQLRTRRPVLLDGRGLDILPYALEAGPEMDRILRQVYGVDLFNPPEEVKRIRPGALLREAGKPLWESWTLEEWDQIRKQFRVSEVLAYADWKLKLPEVIRNKEFVLYRIPESK